MMTTDRLAISRLVAGILARTPPPFGFAKLRGRMDSDRRWWLACRRWAPARLGSLSFHGGRPRLLRSSYCTYTDRASRSRCARLATYVAAGGRNQALHEHHDRIVRTAKRDHYPVLGVLLAWRTHEQTVARHT